MAMFDIEIYVEISETLARQAEVGRRTPDTKLPPMYRSK